MRAPRVGRTRLGSRTFTLQSSTKFLNYYASRLNSVEVNYTFRSLPTKKLLKDWIAATPPGFKFAVKAHQTITHIKRLRNVMRVTSKFVASLLPLQKQASSVQCYFNCLPI